jgi:hypothetical protein
LMKTAGVRVCITRKLPRATVLSADHQVKDRYTS